MLFHSYLFMLIFLPVTALGYFLLTKIKGRDLTIPWLAIASLVFYAFWGLNFVLVLLFSILLNFSIVYFLYHASPDSRSRRWLLLLGIVGNLVLLGYFKYTNFFIQNVNALLNTDIQYLSLLFPIGISFYTFIQIGCLVDAYNGQVEKLTFSKYVLFGMFFPYITAGPLVQQREMFRQMEVPAAERTNATHVALGLTLFFMGLFKKVVFADSIAPYANTFFEAAALGEVIGVASAWLGILAYTLQLYFDFSGYSDMAIGLGCMLGLRLPLNFNSPLKATSIIEFWRRWHMTMTRFFTNYIYTPIATTGMRRSLQRAYSTPRRLLAVVVFPVIITFTLAGLWHGPGWVFVIFGLIHGLALGINHIWREVQRSRKLPGLPGGVAWLLTILVFVLSLAFFRADSVGTAAHILATMFGFGAGGASGVAAFYGASALLTTITIAPIILWLTLLGFIALALPNTQEILGNYQVALDSPPRTSAPKLIRARWRPSLGWSIVIGLASMIAFSLISGQSPFLYYQF